MNFFVERNSCPACKSKKHSTIYSCSFQKDPIRTYLQSYSYSNRFLVEFDYLNEATYILDKCSNCGLVYQREIPNDFLMKKLYQDWIDPKKAFEAFGDHTQMQTFLDCQGNNSREVMMLLSYFDVDPAKLRFLDAGMGWGSWCLMAKAFGVNTFGIELSQFLIELAHSNGIKTLSWNELIGKTFNFINTEQFFEHIERPFETLSHLTESLEADGIIKISVPDGRDVIRRLKVFDWTAPIGSRNSLHIVHPLEHINCYNRSSLIKMAKLAGLQEVKMPLRLQYSYNTNWRSVRIIAKNLIRPLYYNLLKRGTYLFFRHADESS